MAMVNSRYFVSLETIPGFISIEAGQVRAGHIQWDYQNVAILHTSRVVLG